MADTFWDHVEAEGTKRATEATEAAEAKKDKEAGAWLCEGGEGMGRACDREDYALTGHSKATKGY